MGRIAPPRLILCWNDFEVESIGCLCDSLTLLRAKVQISCKSKFHQLVPNFLPFPIRFKAKEIAIRKLNEIICWWIVSHWNSSAYSRFSDLCRCHVFLLVSVKLDAMVRRVSESAKYWPKKNEIFFRATYNRLNFFALDFTDFFPTHPHACRDNSFGHGVSLDLHLGIPADRAQ